MERNPLVWLLIAFPISISFLPNPSIDIRPIQRTHLWDDRNAKQPYASISTMKIVNVTEEQPVDEPLSESVQIFYETVSFWQQVDENTQIVYDEDDDDLEIPIINSIVFEFNNTFILAILKAEDRVNEQRLSEAVSSSLGVDNPILKLASSEKLLDLCGFEAGTVPPIGIKPALAVVDDHIALETVVKAGGGLPDQSLILPVDVLFQAQSLVQVAPIADIEPQAAEPTTMYSKPDPFFDVEPPDSEIVKQVLNGEDNPLEPLYVVCCGKIASVRRIARQLAFCDFIPIDSPAWRSATTGETMAVQLIAGQTICKEVGEAAIRKLKENDLILIHGHTNANSIDSLHNWNDKRVLDIVLHRYEILKQDVQTINEIKVEESLERTRQSVSVPIDPKNCLQMADLYNDSDPVNGDTINSRIVVVDDISMVKAFSKDLARLLKTATSNEDALPLVGIDCEWQPNFLLPNLRDPQPVLLLQICLHPKQRTYLFDLNTLLRPMMPESQPMDKLEKEVSFCLGALFESKKLVKVGFSILQDLRQLAASYPHVPAFQFYNMVMESSTLGKKAMRMAKLSHSREATSSLSRLVRQFTGKYLDKSQQCSDWARRPLSKEQIEYAALDAAVTPAIVEKMIRDMGARFFSEVPQLGRAEDDRSFQKMLSSFRFVFVETTDNIMMKKLKARRVVGDVLVVTQTWTTGQVPPKLPAVDEGEGGRYRDTMGVLKVPSESVRIQTERFNTIVESFVGKRIWKSKQQCVEPFLCRGAAIPDGSLLEFPPRSGFIEFADGIALFVNMPTVSMGESRSRSYPNQWFNGGKVLSWFLRDREWGDGTSSLANKILGDSVVTLFVKLDGLYLFCGRCKAFLDKKDENSSENWTLKQLYLVLLDFDKLCSCSADFRNLLASVTTTSLNVDLNLG